MGSQEQLLWATVLALFFQGISISGNTASGNEIITKEQERKKVSLVCKEGNNETRWSKDGTNLTYQGKELVLAVMDDPRGIYVCINSNKESRPLQVFIRSAVPELHPSGLHHNSGDFSSQPHYHSLPGYRCVPHSRGRAGPASPSF
ncbi:uncharacterized protein LOC131203841 isoform X2 [Ahaetulla prasina]|uniref:uncharacterized protein LOC131203841 isoform X2 n=1 Tax=Ahaetulla prasina TaxID=499056 RepID=UPI002649D949|nr:uncharacterized protein LOC131203841 isoform X2 [Ahaetulla prasina]